ncbi:MAG: hypothetical protein QXU23_03280 [Candidatus Korarchaeum sp.]
MSLADDLLKELEKNPELAKRFARKLIEYIEPELSVPVQIGKLVEQMNRVAEEQKRLREDFNEMLKRVDRNTRAITQLRGAIRGLLEAQAKSEERLSRLEVAVERNAEAITKLSKAVDELREAQAKSEERLSRLEVAVDKLREAQAKSEERLSRLEVAVDKLVTAVAELRVEVGRLSDTVGYGLEDIARILVPPWLERLQGVELVSELRREFLRLDGEEVEVNLYSEGKKEGRDVRVLGEVKSRIYGGDVRRLYNNAVSPLRRAGFEVIAFMVGYVVHPSAREEAEKLGISVIAAYEFRVL